MSKFNTRSARPAATSPVFSETTPSGLTHEGAAGYARDVQSELFLLAVSNMVGEHTFYENADNRDTRYAELVREAAVNYPDWTARFLRWLRHEANMRTASLVGAAEFVKARLDHGESCESVTNRSVIFSVLRRADEPGEMLAYWAEMYSRAFPMPVKRGVADAILRLGTEFNYVKWDSEGRGYRFADLLNLTHPGDRKGSAQHIRGDLQHSLFDYIVKKRYQSGLPVPETLPLLTRRQALLDLPVDERHTALDDPSRLRAAGMTWESLAGWLQGPMDAAAWEAIIPSMGLMALVRNLRNFDNSGVSDDVAAQVANRIADPEQVTGAKLFPMQFLSAYRSAPSLRWAWALEQAITHSLANVPRLEGNTLVLIDTSGSMADRFSKDGSLARWDAAAVFGLALGSRCANADVVSFSGGSWSAHSQGLRPTRGRVAAEGRRPLGVRRVLPQRRNRHRRRSAHTFPRP
ncbi:TROVE domain-containing protein [Amycolatopsis sp. cmx-4-54]|uniref:TROVE domain-containing protein n=1 Tax=Amycolatopsis sp. cmx-4-54 TaxID=2790936 RepID=UPI00397D4D2E